jgi:hypothetical protein
MWVCPEPVLANNRLTLNPPPYMSSQEMHQNEQQNAALCCAVMWCGVVWCGVVSTHRVVLRIHRALERRQPPEITAHHAKPRTTTATATATSSGSARRGEATARYHERAPSAPASSTSFTAAPSGRPRHGVARRPAAAAPRRGARAASHHCAITSAAAAS